MCYINTTIVLIDFWLMERFGSFLSGVLALLDLNNNNQTTGHIFLRSHFNKFNSVFGVIIICSGPRSELPIERSRWTVESRLRASANDNSCKNSVETFQFNSSKRSMYNHEECNVTDTVIRMTSLFHNGPQLGKLRAQKQGRGIHSQTK